MIALIAGFIHFLLLLIPILIFLTVTLLPFGLMAQDHHNSKEDIQDAIDYLHEKADK